MPTITSGKNEIFYTVHQEKGPNLVLIHGAGGSHLHWPAELRRLPQATVYAIDLPGHGRSQGQGRTRIEDYTDDLVGFLDAVGIDQAILVGHSMGGAIAQTTALTAPDRTAGLILVGSGARLRVAPAIIEGLSKDAEQTIALITEWAWAPEADPALVSKGHQEMLKTPSPVILGDFKACDAFDVRERVVSISAPVLAITGSVDRLTPPKFGQWLADHIPNARFVSVQGAGHMVMLEKPDQVTQEAQTFLGDLEPS